MRVCVLCASCDSPQCGVIQFVEDARSDNVEEAYSIADLMTALLVAMSISFCLRHPIAVSAFIIY